VIKDLLDIRVGVSSWSATRPLMKLFRWREENLAWFISRVRHLLLSENYLKK